MQARARLAPTSSTVDSWWVLSAAVCRYVTTVELQRAASTNATLSRLIRAQRNRTTELRSDLRSRLQAVSDSSGGGGGDSRNGAGGLADMTMMNVSRAAMRKQRAALRDADSRACDTGVLLTRALGLSARVATDGPPPPPPLAADAAVGASLAAAAAREQQLSARVLSRLRALPCDGSEVVALEDHAVEDRLRRRRLRPPAALAPVSLDGGATGAGGVGVGAGAGVRGSGIGNGGRAARAVWAAVQAPRLAAVLGEAASGRSAPRPEEVATWLARDAKCIDELFQMGKLKAGAANKPKATAAGSG